MIVASGSSPSLPKRMNVTGPGFKCKQFATTLIRTNRPVDEVKQPGESSNLTVNRLMYLLTLPSGQAQTDRFFF